MAAYVDQAGERRLTACVEDAGERWPLPKALRPLSIRVRKIMLISNANIDPGYLTERRLDVQPRLRGNRDSLVRDYSD